jgi:hypothetical protein
MTTSTVAATHRDRRPVSRASGTTARTVALTAAVTLLGSALATAESAPGGAATLSSYPEAGFSLGLDAAFPVIQLADATASPLPLTAPLQEHTTGAVARQQPDGRSRLRPVELRDSPGLLRLQAQLGAGESTSSHGGFGTWLKKHWWAPVLVAAAAGVAIADSGGDDDKGGEDD